MTIGLKPVFGMKRVFFDNVYQYKATWWVKFIPKFILKIMWGY